MHDMFGAYFQIALCSANPSDLNASEIEQEALQHTQTPIESNLPVIRKKEHDYLGLFEYKKENEQPILKALIYGKNTPT